MIYISTIWPRIHDKALRHSESTISMHKNRYPFTFVVIPIISHYRPVKLYSTAKTALRHVIWAKSFCRFKIDKIAHYFLPN